MEHFLVERPLIEHWFIEHWFIEHLLEVAWGRDERCALVVLGADSGARVQVG